MNKIVIGIVFVFLIGLVVWNVYLTNKIVTLRKINNNMSIKLEACNGSLDVLSYDLVTSRDSVRILNNQLEALSTN